MRITTGQLMAQFMALHEAYKAIGEASNPAAENLAYEEWAEEALNAFPLLLAEILEWRADCRHATECRHGAPMKTIMVPDVVRDAAIRCAETGSSYVWADAILLSRFVLSICDPRHTPEPGG